MEMEMERQDFHLAFSYLESSSGDFLGKAMPKCLL